MRHLLPFIAIASLLLAIGGCNGKDKTDGRTADTLSMLIAAVDSVKLPLQLGTDGSVTAIEVDSIDSLLTFGLTLADDYVDSASLVDNSARQDFTLRLILESASMKRVLTLARNVPVRIKIDVATVDHPTPFGSFTVDAPRLQVLAMDAPSERERDEVKVYNHVIYDNYFCPYEIEDGVTLLAMTVQDRYVTFHTEIDVEKLDFFVMKQNRDSVNVAVVQSLQDQLADSLTRQSLLDIAKARLGYRNRYISSDRADSFDISFTPSDLEKLITLTDSVGKSH